MPKRCLSSCLLATHTQSILPPLLTPLTVLHLHSGGVSPGAPPHRHPRTRTRTHPCGFQTPVAPRPPHRVLAALGLTLCHQLPNPSCTGPTRLPPPPCWPPALPTWCPAQAAPLVAGPPSAPSPPAGEGRPLPAREPPGRQCPWAFPSRVPLDQRHLRAPPGCWTTVHILLLPRAVMLQTRKAHQPGPQGPPESMGRRTGGEDQLQGRLVDVDQGGGDGL